jgi:hypothetical protein
VLLSIVFFKRRGFPIAKETNSNVFNTNKEVPLNPITLKYTISSAIILFLAAAIAGV